MSKRNVMKSVIAMVMVGFILSLSSCQKDEKKIVGVWKHEKGELKEFACTDPILEAQLRAIFQAEVLDNSGTVEFTEDGKAIFLNEGRKEVGTYTIKDGVLTIIAIENMHGDFTCSFPNKTTMQWDADFLAGASASQFLAMGITKCTIRVTLKKQ